MLTLSTRKGASAFNQPVSFDTSNVTSMAGMFSVRSARALPLTSIVGPSLLLAPTTPFRLLARMSPFLLCFHFVLPCAKALVI